MKNVIISLFLCLSFSYAIASQEPSDDVAVYEKQLLIKYGPTKTKCGAGSNVSGTRMIANELEPFEPMLACMISGNRDVFLIDNGSKPSISVLQKKLMKKHGIQYIDSPVPILYTPKGKQRADLLSLVSAETSSYEGVELRGLITSNILQQFKSMDELEKMVQKLPLSQEKKAIFSRAKDAFKKTLSQLGGEIAIMQGKNSSASGGDYLIGTLLGYDPEDILKFYRDNNQLEKYESDKKTALEWLEKQKAQQFYVP